ncbi:hypothetical protein ACHWQZ_G018151 [Mnemiopsis leidyi]
MIRSQFRDDTRYDLTDAHPLDVFASEAAFVRGPDAEAEDATAEDATAVDTTAEDAEAEDTTAVDATAEDTTAEDTTGTICSPVQ